MINRSVIGCQVVELRIFAGGPSLRSFDLNEYHSLSLINPDTWISGAGKEAASFLPANDNVVVGRAADIKPLLAKF
jgi:hypothetical protein